MWPLHYGIITTVALLALMKPNFPILLQWNLKKKKNHMSTYKKKKKIMTAHCCQ